MRFIDVQGFCIRNNKQVAFQEWVAKNEERIKKSYPAGNEFGGIIRRCSTRRSTRAKQNWPTSSIATPPWTAAPPSPRTPRATTRRSPRLLFQFLDTDRSAGSSRIVLKSVVDATIFNLPTP